MPPLRFLMSILASLSLFVFTACQAPAPAAVPYYGTSYYGANAGYQQPAYQQPSYQQPTYAQAPVAQPAYLAGGIDAAATYTATSAPVIRAASYLLIDANTGKPLVARNADTVRGVASTQKLLTALVVLDAGNLDKRVTIQSTDTQVEPTKLGVRAGEVYTRRELLYAFLVKSANDLAKVLARDNAGSQAAFAIKMNAKARALGMRASHFCNPHGLTAPGQCSTARDMARVAMAAYRSDFIRDAVRRKYYSFRFNSGRRINLENTNDLLGVMPECNGMKTGYTNAAGRCLISSAASGGRAVILIQLGTKTKYIWDDARTLMTWGLRRL
jgi:serine-type D-Ala-D-Ala carboxypeptidase (penicillin-binding protein 5/6)